jgi:peptidoglycan/LPS O-acetylase OafA/YrhL
MASHKLDFVDRVRGVAILMVIAVHYAQAFATPTIHRGAMIGQFGVQLFFVASAFTLCLSADHRRAEASPVRNFYLRRFFRIAPLYYLAIPIYAWIFAGEPRGAFYTAPNMAANLAFLHGLVPAANNTIVPGGWTIGAEMLFYLTFPALYPLIERAWQRHGCTALALAVGLSLALALGWHLGWRAVNGRWIGNSDFGYCAMPAQLGVFVMGIAYYLHAWKGGNLAPRAWRDGALAMGLVGIAGWILIARIAPLMGLAPSIAGIGAVFAVNWLRGRGGEGGWLAAVGRVSYSLYIIHFALVWRGGAWLVQGFAGDPRTEWALALPLYLAEVALLYGLGRLTWRYIEEPGNALARRIIARAEARGFAVAAG